ncbi:hypothetical protein JOF53_001550 [Crossiella equi]|uniref:Pentapeptide repeat-containing protein n=1 Tax=Crossiella equi TaxID=130796 RepID=A0ABS5A7V2_9PSEU|nr:pentapeptide repeat-containing protein [Crossiella equi]MBP2472678.1 hypothetical protein [Crossiella equi]
MPTGPHRRRPALSAATRIRRAPRVAHQPEPHVPQPRPAEPAPVPQPETSRPETSQPDTPAQRPRPVFPGPPLPPPPSRARWVLPVAALVVGVVALGTLWVVGRTLAATEEQLAIAQRAQLATRFADAVKQLDNPGQDIRLGGLHGLDRVAQEAPAERGAVTAMLAAFVRTRAPITACADGPAGLRQPTQDVQAALRLLARPTDRGPDRVDLTRTCLAGADLRQADLDRVDLAGTDLTRANLSGAHLRSADLSDSTLVQTDLSGADLRRADGERSWTTRLRQANLTGANLARANLSGADLAGAELTSADLTGTDLSGADLDSATGLPG